VVSLLDGEGAKPAEEAQPATQNTSTRALPAGATLACLAAPLAVALGLPSALRMAAVLSLVCLRPPRALVTLLRGRPEPALMLGVGLATTVVSAMATVWIGFWSP
jgi:hypothetical protein